jgi:uncharacterized integral membrane protein
VERRAAAQSRVMLGQTTEPAVTRRPSRSMPSGMTPRRATRTSRGSGTSGTSCRRAPRVRRARRRSRRGVPPRADAPSQSPRKRERGARVRGRARVWAHDSIGDTVRSSDVRVSAIVGVCPARSRVTRTARASSEQASALVHVGGVVCVLLVILIILIAKNTQSVELDWVFGTSRASVVWVILAAAVIGWVLGIATSVVFRFRTRKRT